jgi:hypothetical protein
MRPGLLGQLMALGLGTVAVGARLEVRRTGYQQSMMH